MGDSASSASDAVPRPKKHHCTYSATLAYSITYALPEKLALSQPQIGKDPQYLQHLFTLIDQEIGVWGIGLLTDSEFPTANPIPCYQPDTIGGDRCQNQQNLTKLQICI